MFEYNLHSIAHSLYILAYHVNTPFYFSSGFWSVIVALIAAMVTYYAVRVALDTPHIVNELNNAPKPSDVKPVDFKIIKQGHYVGRLILNNFGKFTARGTEAYLERIIFDGKERENFFPMPLNWSHGQLNVDGPATRNIYSNQTVYLDIFNVNSVQKGFSVESQLRPKFVFASGDERDNFTKFDQGRSDIYIKLYQESGQVVEIHLETIWDGTGIPSMNII